MFILISKKKLYGFIIVLILIVSLIICFFAMKSKDKAAINSINKAYVAIVIDDFGNNSAGTDEMLNIDIPLTAAIMPFMPSAQVDEKKALEKGKEVIIHLPMEPEVGKRSWLGPKGITTDLSDDQIKSMVEEAFQIIPSSKGMNNHMGSKAIKDERVMKNIFTILKEKDRFFLDSKTTSDATACRVASESKVKYYKRDIFLDNEKSVASIEKQLDKLTDVALKNGYAIGIGHVGVEGGKITADAIKNKMPEMKKRGIEFVFLSQIP